jgi:hypothetical protein
MNLSLETENIENETGMRGEKLRGCGEVNSSYSHFVGGW